MFILLCEFERITLLREFEMIPFSFCLQIDDTLQHTATHCNTCNTLQHVPTRLIVSLPKSLSSLLNPLTPPLSVSKQENVFPKRSHWITLHYKHAHTLHHWS